MIKEFKEFALKGNLVDLATAFILGAAFGRLVTSFVSDILMPPIGLVLGNVDFSNLFVNLTRTPYKSLAEAQAAGVPTLNYGLFINSVIDFLIVAFALFFGNQAGESAGKTSACLGNKRLSVLPFQNSRSGNTLSCVHVKPYIVS